MSDTPTRDLEAAYEAAAQAWNDDGGFDLSDRLVKAIVDAALAALGPIYRRGDLNCFGMTTVNDGEYAYPLAAEYLDALVAEGGLVEVWPNE